MMMPITAWAQDGCRNYENGQLIYTITADAGIGATAEIAEDKVYALQGTYLSKISYLCGSELVDNISEECYYTFVALGSDNGETIYVLKRFIDGTYVKDDKGSIGYTTDIYEAFQFTAAPAEHLDINSLPSTYEDMWNAGYTKYITCADYSFASQDAWVFCGYPFDYEIDVRPRYLACYNYPMFAAYIEMNCWKLTEVGTGKALVDGEEYTVTEDTEYLTLTYERSLPNTEWNALYVPFEIPVSELAEDYDVAYINDVHSYDNDNNGEIDELKMEVIHITAGTLNANYPYLIRAKNEEAKAMSLELKKVTLYAAKENSVTCSSVFMQFDVTGTYSQKTAADLTDAEGNKSLVITTDGSWKQLEEESVLNPFRLYLTMTALDGSPVKVAPEAARSMRIVTRGESEGTTRIENSKLKIENSSAVYDLQGRRVAQPTKGIYVVNGKKMLIK